MNLYLHLLTVADKPYLDPAQMAFSRSDSSQRTAVAVEIKKPDYIKHTINAYQANTFHKKNQLLNGHLIKGIGPKHHTYFYSVVLELFWCYSISIR